MISGFVGRTKESLSPRVVCTAWSGKESRKVCKVPLSLPPHLHPGAIKGSVSLCERSRADLLRKVPLQRVAALSQQHQDRLLQLSHSELLVQSLTQPLMQTQPLLSHPDPSFPENREGMFLPYQWRESFC